MLSIRQGLMLRRIPSVALQKQIRTITSTSKLPELSSTLSSEETENLRLLYNGLSIPETEIMPLFERATSTLSAEDKTKVCAKILEQIQDDVSNKRVLETALAHVNSQDISIDAINNLVKLAPKIEESYKSINPGVQAKYAQLFKDHGNDELITQLMSISDKSKGRLLKHILTIMLLKSKRYSDAKSVVLTSLQSRSKLSPITIELLVLHLCELNDVDEIRTARLILGLAKNQRHPIQPRTWSTLLTKAAQLNDFETCYKIQRNVRDRTFVDNGTLITLAESLVHKGAYQMVWGIEKEVRRKKSFPPEFSRRLEIAVVESVAVKEGFYKAWNKMKEIHKGQKLEVADYPYLTKSFKFKDDQEELSFIIHQQMNVANDELKSFILNLMVKNLSDSGQVRKALVMLRSSSVLRGNIRENVILQLIHGSFIVKDPTILKEVYDLVKENGTKFHEKKTINFFISALIGTEYSAYILQVLKLVDVENFKLRFDIYEQLQKSCDQTGINPDLIAKYQP